MMIRLVPECWRRCVWLASGAILLMALAAADATAAPGQAADNPGFRTLPRPIHYETPLNPRQSAKALIVYGKDAPWTQNAAQVVQKAIEDWSGAKLQLADDQTVTGEETWLLKNAYRKVPLIVLGNAKVNRVIHALGTRYLAQSNRSWPGGDRYIIRSIFEPFVADVNYIVLEASTEAGMDGAAANFAKILGTLPADAKASATIPPRLRVISGVKDKWQNETRNWGQMPKEWAGMKDRSVSEMVKAFQGKPFMAGWAAITDGNMGAICEHFRVGPQAGQSAAQNPQAMTMDLHNQRAVAAMSLLACRAVGGRTYGYYDHYGATPYANILRALFQTGILSEGEINEFENCLTLSGALPLDNVFNDVSNGEPTAGYWGNDRHLQACLLATLQILDYVANHCRLDAKTRQEIDRRYENARKLTARLARSFRDNPESDSMGEDTIMQFYSLLHQGWMENVRRGLLRLSADAYILSTDNYPGGFAKWGCYVGLDGFSSCPGAMTKTWSGGALVSAAAFYYDDPQYRWLVNRGLPQGLTGAETFAMHEIGQAAGEAREAVRYYGVRAVPFDERVYKTLTHEELRSQKPRLPPEPFEKAMDRLAFRDGFEPNDAYLFLATCQSMKVYHGVQNNAIARFTDLGDIWLFHNTFNPSGWARNVLSISNGKPYVPRAACTLEALANLGEVSAASSKEQGIAGADWTRTIVHWRGHYFVVLDRMEAQADDEFAFVCRWRTPQSAVLQDGAWVATGVSGNTLRIQNTEPIFQTSEYWECDGAKRPYVLQQYNQAKLVKGEAKTCQNLLYVSGEGRPDRFEARRVNAQAVLVKGKTTRGEHMALIGIGGRIPLVGFETDAAIYDVMDNKLHLAGVTALKAPVKGALTELFWSQKPVNLLVDCRTGRGQVDIPGEKPVQIRIAAGPAAEAKPGFQDVALAEPNALPECSALIEALWNQGAAPTAVPAEGIKNAPIFQAQVAQAALQRPYRRITNVAVTSTPPPDGVYHDGWFWSGTDNLEITISFPTPMAVGCLRLPGIMKAAPVGHGGANIGPYYEAGDFTFSLVLSDDNFQKDLRKIDKPRVTFEETPNADIINHSDLRRLPTWRIEVGGRAKQIKLMPRPTTTDRRNLKVVDLEVYGPEQVDQLRCKAYVGDVNGDGSNELVVSTVEKEVAAYDAGGKQLWRKVYPGEIMRTDVADLEEDGKAETMVYLTTEELHRINGDGSERPLASIFDAERKAFNGGAGVGAVCGIAVWAPEGATKKEVLLSAETSFRVRADGTVQLIRMPGGGGTGAYGRLVNFYPNEPEVLVSVNHYGLNLFSARRYIEGNYTILASKPVTPDMGTGTSFGWVRQIDLPACKGFLAAIEGGINWFPASAFQPNSKDQGWGFNSGGVPVVAALAEDVNGDGVPEVFLARLDGFVNVFKVADGASLGLLSIGEPVLGMAMLKGKDGKPQLAVGTKFGVHLFGPDLKPLGHQAVAAAAFAGPGGKERDRVYVIDMAGRVTILMIQ